MAHSVFFLSDRKGFLQFLTKNLSGHLRKKLNGPSCLESKVVYGKVVPDLLESINSRRCRHDVWSFFSFLICKKTTGYFRPSEIFAHHWNPFVEIMSFLIRHISPKMTFLKDYSTDYQMFTRPRSANEILINNEFRRNQSILPLRGENQEQIANSTRKRKLAAIALSPTMTNTDHLKTPSTIKSPDFGSCRRPTKEWNPDTPMIEIRTVPKKHQYQTLLNYGFIYNPTTIDENDFTRKSEATFTLSCQFDNENDNSNSNEDEVQSVSENDHSDNDNDGHISESNNSDEGEQEHDSEQEQANMFVQGHIQMNTCTAESPYEYLLDSGASLSGVISETLISNQQPCHIPITPAFGAPMHAKTRGTINDPLIGHLGIPALHLPAMNQNLVSVFGFCGGGSTGIQQMGVFTVEGCRFYPIQANKDVLKILSDRPRTLQGLAKQGVYVYSANPSKSN